MQRSTKTTLFKLSVFCAAPLALFVTLFVVSRPIRATKDLSVALNRTDYKSVRVLAGRAKNVNVASQDGKTPLMMAIEHDDITTVRVLLKKGADVNQTDNNGFGGETPLMIAAMRTNVEVVKLLLAHGARTNMREGHGFTVLQMAQSCSEFPCDEPSKRRHQLIVPLLKRAGAKR